MELALDFLRGSGLIQEWGEVDTGQYEILFPPKRGYHGVENFFVKLKDVPLGYSDVENNSRWIIESVRDAFATEQVQGDDYLCATLNKLEKKILKS